MKEVNYRRVIASACKYGDVVFVGVRHYDEIMTAQIKSIPEDEEIRMMNRGEVVQGFIDNKYNFLNREEAMKLVIESGQPFDIERNGGDDKELYSEGIH
jgi:hypothetical protein